MMFFRSLLMKKLFFLELSISYSPALQQQTGKSKFPDTRPTWLQDKFLIILPNQGLASNNISFFPANQYFGKSRIFHPSSPKFLNGSSSVPNSWWYFDDSNTTLLSFLSHWFDWLQGLKKLQENNQVKPDKEQFKLNFVTIKMLLSLLHAVPDCIWYLNSLRTNRYHQRILLLTDS